MTSPPLTGLCAKFGACGESDSQAMAGAWGQESPSFPHTSIPLRPIRMLFISLAKKHVQEGQ